MGHCRAGMIAQAGIQAQVDAVQICANGGSRPQTNTFDERTSRAGFGLDFSRVWTCLSSVCVAALVLICHAPRGFLWSIVASVLNCLHCYGTRFIMFYLRRRHESPRYVTIRHDLSRVRQLSVSAKPSHPCHMMSYALPVLQLQSAAQAMFCL